MPRPHATVLLGLLLALAAGHGLAAPAASAQGLDGDPIAAVRGDAKRLVAEERYADALRLLRAVSLDSLPASRALELKSWIASIETEKEARLVRDLAEAERLGQGGDLAAATRILDRVEDYGDAADKERAARTRARVVRTASATAEASAAEQEAAEALAAAKAARYAAETKALEASAQKIVKTWIGHRKKLRCSGCKGYTKRRCKRCAGAGRKRDINRYGGTSWKDCRSCVAGITVCGDCKGSGLASSRLDDVLFKPFAPAFQKKLGGKARFMKRAKAYALSGDASGDAAFDALIGRYGFALSPVVNHSKLQVILDDDHQRATVRFAVILTERNGTNPEQVTETVDLVRDGEKWRFAAPID